MNGVQPSRGYLLNGIPNNRSTAPGGGRGYRSHPRYYLYSSYPRQLISHTLLRLKHREVVDGLGGTIGKQVTAHVKVPTEGGHRALHAEGGP